MVFTTEIEKTEDPHQDSDEEINDHEKIARVLTTILDDGNSLFHLILP